MSECKSCNFIHIRDLCGAHVKVKSLIACTAQSEVKDATMGSGALLMYQSIPVRGAPLVDMLYDTGTNISLVLRSYVEENQLQVMKAEVPLSVTLAMGQKQQLLTQAYAVPLIDQWGREVRVLALAVEGEAGCVRQNNTDATVQLLGLDKLSVLVRTAQLLLGTDNAQLLPRCFD